MTKSFQKDEFTTCREMMEIHSECSKPITPVPVTRGCKLLDTRSERGNKPMITDKTIISNCIDWLQYTTPQAIFPDWWQVEYVDVKTGLWGYTHRRVYPDGRLVLENLERPDMQQHVVLDGGTLDEIQARYGD